MEIIFYIVEKGDCLTKIAEKFKVSVKEIAELNEITNVDTINIGDKLMIKKEE